MKKNSVALLLLFVLLGCALPLLSARAELTALLVEPTGEAVFVSGEATPFTLSLQNQSSTPVRDVTVTPEVSDDASRFPFKLTRDGWATPCVNDGDVSAEGDDLNPEDLGAEENRTGTASFLFTARADALSGTYPLRFTVSWIAGGTPRSEVYVFPVTVVNPALNGQREIAVPEESRDVEFTFTLTPEIPQVGSPCTAVIRVRNCSRSTWIGPTLLCRKADFTTEDYSLVSGEEAVFTAEFTVKEDLSVLPVTLMWKTVIGETVRVSKEFSVSAHYDAAAELGEPLPDPAQPTEGSEIAVSVPIRNVGSSTLHQGLLHLSFDGSSASVLLNDLPAGAETEAVIRLTVPEAGTHTLTASFAAAAPDGHSCTASSAHELTVLPASAEPEPEPPAPEPFTVSTWLTSLPVGIRVLMAAGGTAAVLFLCWLILGRQRRRYFKRRIVRLFRPEEKNSEPKE